MKKLILVDSDGNVLFFKDVKKDYIIDKNILHETNIKKLNFNLKNLITDDQFFIKSNIIFKIVNIKKDRIGNLIYVGEIYNFTELLQNK